MRLVQKLASYVDLPKSEIAAIEAAFEATKIVRARREILKGSNLAPTFIVILSGWAVYHRHLPSGARQVLAYLLPGDTLDSRTIMPGELDLAVTAITRCDIAAVPATLFDKVLRYNPSFAAAMSTSRNVTEATLRSWLMMIGRKSALERTAHLLLELHARARLAGLVDQTGAAECPVGQSSLADTVGLTSVHMNRMLQALRRSGDIELSGNKLRIVDAASLSRFAGFDSSYLGVRQ